MLVIRLARGGRNKYPTYRIVAAEQRFTATGRYVEVLGRYNPHTKELVMDKEGIERRVGQGAQPSNTVLRLMVREGIELPKWAKLAQKQRAPKKEPEVKEETPVTEAEAEAEVATAEAPAAEEAPAVEETPAQEAAEEITAEATGADEAKAYAAKTDAGETTEADATAQEEAADGAEKATLDSKEEAAK